MIPAQMKDSSSPYMMSLHRVEGIGIVLGGRGDARRARWPLRERFFFGATRFGVHHPQDVINARAKHKEIDHDKGGERCCLGFSGHGFGGHGGKAVGGAQQSLDSKRLAPDLGGDPAGKDGDKGHR